MALLVYYDVFDPVLKKGQPLLVGEGDGYARIPHLLETLGKSQAGEA